MGNAIWEMRYVIFVSFDRQKKIHLYTIWKIPFQCSELIIEKHQGDENTFDFFFPNNWVVITWLRGILLLSDAYRTKWNIVFNRK